MVLSSLVRLSISSTEEQLAENHRKMLMAMSEDIRVILVKLSDRLHNMRTLSTFVRTSRSVFPEKPWKSMRHLLIVWDFKCEVGTGRSLFSAISIQLNFTRLSHDEGKRQEREALVDEVVTKLEEYSSERHLTGKIYGRPKHIYSIYRKMQDKKNALKRSTT